MALLIGAEQYYIFHWGAKFPPPMQMAKDLSKLVYNYPVYRYISHIFSFGFSHANARWREEKLFHFFLPYKERLNRLEEIYQKEQQLNKKTLKK